MITHVFQPILLLDVRPGEARIAGEGMMGNVQSPKWVNMRCIQPFDFRRSIW